MFEGSVTKVHYFNVGVLERSLVSFLWRNYELQMLKQTKKPQCGPTSSNTHHVRIVLHIVIRVDEKNVLRL